jgi:hypothetical protein
MKLPSIAPNHSWHLVDAFSKNFCSNPNQWWIAAIFPCWFTHFKTYWSICYFAVSALLLGIFFLSRPPEDPRGRVTTWQARSPSEAGPWCCLAATGGILRAKPQALAISYADVLADVSACECLTFR